MGRAKCHGQLGHVVRERFKEARSAGKPEMELERHLNYALQGYHKALELLPTSAVNDLAVVHNALGGVYGEAGDLDRALLHCREAVHYVEGSGDLYHAAMARRNMAQALAGAGRFDDALEYAHAALRDYETYGDRAQKEIQETYQLIAELESGLNKKGKGEGA